MLAFVVIGLVGSAAAGGVGDVAVGPLRGGHGHPPVVPGPPIFLKGGAGAHGGGLFGAPLLLKGGLHGHLGPHAVPHLLKAGHGPVAAVGHGAPILLKGAGHGGFGGPLGHAHLFQGQPLLLKGGAGFGHFVDGHFGHHPFVGFPGLAVKAGHGAGFGGVIHGPVVQGPPIFVKGGVVAGHGFPVVKGAPLVHGPPVVVKGGHGAAVVKDAGLPVALKAGLGGAGHEQHAVSGPSYLITTVHHVQKVSPGGKLIASFPGHGAALGGFHGGAHGGKPW